MEVLLSDLDIEVLLALVWAGPFLTLHLRQIIEPCWSFRQLQRRLAYLEQRVLIGGAFFYRARKQQPGPARIGKVWSITARGEELILRHDRAPYCGANETRGTLLNHDLSVSQVIAHLIARTRLLASGLAVFREMRIDDQRPAPIADTIVVLRTRRERMVGSALPWSRQGVQPDEALRVIAIESDRGSEDLGVIAEKARVYRLLADDPDYLERYAGVMPLPLWLAPTKRRVESIHATWQRVWPAGSWLRTTDTGLREDRFIEYQAGRERLRNWLDEWERSPSAQEQALRQIP